MATTIEAAASTDIHLARNKAAVAEPAVKQEQIAIQNDVCKEVGFWGDECPEDSNPPNFGIACVNWGGDRRDSDVQLHMEHDIITSPAQVICLQEASAYL